jgi:nucleotidyltransferase substrate binding protein (TIGR01987 family)
MKETDIRWEQRFNNFIKALIQLEEFVEKGEALNKLEIQGLVKAFEYTYELGWNILKDYLEFQGNQNVYGSRDAITEAFRLGLIEDGEGWMNMFKDRNRTAHTYNEKTANEIANNILRSYANLFKALRHKFDTIIGAK